MKRDIKGRNGKCGECRWFKATKLTRDPYWNDGICKHPTRNGKNRKTPYKVFSRASCCFDAEDPEDNKQITLEDLNHGDEGAADQSGLAPAT